MQYPETGTYAAIDADHSADDLIARASRRYRGPKAGPPVEQFAEHPGRIVSSHFPAAGGR